MQNRPRNPASAESRPAVSWLPPARDGEGGCGAARQAAGCAGHSARPGRPFGPARFRALALALALAVPGLPQGAQAQDLGAGSYACRSAAKDFGSIEIDGARYRGPGGGGWNGLRRIGPAIIWNGSLGAISEAGEVVGTAMDGNGFTIQIKDRASGVFTLVSCRR